MVSVSNLFEAVVNFTSRAQKTFGVSPKMKQYLEGLKKEQENILGKPENKNINPLRQFDENRMRIQNVGE